MNQAVDKLASGWRKVQETLFTPKVDDAALDAAMREASARQPPPVLWLIGKTQSGKTSLIRALTGSPRAEIGSGFRPCTRTASFYDFPLDAPVVRFLDTRGLGETHYDPTDDIRYCESESHLIIAVVKAVDTHPEAVNQVLRAVRKRHPDWPVVIVQTCLHELYPAEMDHILPYPYDQTDWPHTLPDDLRRALLAQREYLGKLPGPGLTLWVPVDLTLPEDDLPPAHYGLDALWDALERASSLGLQAMLRIDPMINDTYARTAHPHIVGYSLTAGALGAIPVVDVALVPALQLKLLQSLAAIYRLPWNTRTSAEFFGLLGAGFMAGYGLTLAGRGLVKLIPGAGQTLGVVWSVTSSVAITFALGKAACFYLARTGKGQTVDAEALQQIYAEALQRGRELIRERTNLS
jgi:uncharacterized protein (DUF697 family)